jgi:hypothetical protein
VYYTLPAELAAAMLVPSSPAASQQLNLQQLQQLHQDQLDQLDLDLELAAVGFCDKQRSRLVTEAQQADCVAMVKRGLYDQAVAYSDMLKLKRQAQEKGPEGQVSEPEEEEKKEEDGRRLLLQLPVNVDGTQADVMVYDGQTPEQVQCHCGGRGDCGCCYGIVGSDCIARVHVVVVCMDVCVLYMRVRVRVCVFVFVTILTIRAHRLLRCFAVHFQKSKTLASALACWSLP